MLPNQFRPVMGLSRLEKKQVKLAIDASLETAEEHLRRMKNNVDHYRDPEPVPKNRNENLEDGTQYNPRFHSTHLMNGTEYARFRNIDSFKMHCPDMELRDGDTLVFVDFPLTLHGKPPVDCDGIPFRSQQFRVHSDRLRETGSSKFAEMLQPTYQFRVQRRRKLVNHLPDGIKYVLDMTPAAEGDEMVFQMTELSLTPAIIKWWSSYARLDVPFFLVKGHDDACRCREIATKAMEDALAKPDQEENQNADGTDTRQPLRLPLSVEELEQARREGRKLQIEKVPCQFEIPDYCPIRHRNGIIRLFMMMEKIDVLLDSAARVWTLVALAKIWDCAGIVQDNAIQWLLHRKNSQFIEAHPEEALKIGDTLSSPQVVRSAFQILVNELAIEEASDHPPPRPNFSQVSLFGRRKGDPGDEYSNLIQHAARALIERAKMQMSLWNEDCLDKWQLPEWQKLLVMENALREQSDYPCFIALSNIDVLKKRLRDTLAFEFYQNTPEDHLASWEHPWVDVDRAKYVEPSDFRPFGDIYSSMESLQRMLTRFPYKYLADSLATKYNDHDGDESYRAILEVEMILADELARLKERNIPTPENWRAAYAAVEGNWPDNLSTYSLFWPQDFRFQVTNKIHDMSGYQFDMGIDSQLWITRHMLYSLKPNEMKFLPLWAGGCNDGTGGVFEDHLPAADMGPSGPGPAYHTGLTIPSGPPSLAGSFVEDMSGMRIIGSETAASVDVNDSISTVYRPDEVIADSKSIASESFQSDNSDYHEARGDAEKLKDTYEDQEDEEPRQQPEMLDAFCLEADSDDSTSTICGDDLGLSDDEDLDLCDVSDSAEEGAPRDVKMVTA